MRTEERNLPTLAELEAAHAELALIATPPRARPGSKRPRTYVPTAAGWLYRRASRRASR